LKIGGSVSESESADVAIVGYGPVGQALALAQHGHRIVVKSSLLRSGDPHAGRLSLQGRAGAGLVRPDFYLFGAGDAPVLVDALAASDTWTEMAAP
jgi:hypothetical protein